MKQRSPCGVFYNSEKETDEKMVLLKVILRCTDIENSYIFESNRKNIFTVINKGRSQSLFKSLDSDRVWTLLKWKYSFS